ncbi:MAG TPA: hypothetical protein VFT34_13070 [Verrucomicrobiae bacterium]|nr:hypothetical protein [Verrucomicrobiae bacterium]
MATAIAIHGLSASAMAQAPANDNPANAQVITGQAGRVTASTVNATKDVSEPNHPLNAGGKSIWYSWTAAGTESIRFDTVGSGFDTILAVYTNLAGELRIVGGTNNPAGTDNPNTGFIDTSGGYLESRVNLANAILGRTYYIAVDGYNAGSGAASGPVVLNWIQIVGAPANDDFNNATALTGIQGGVSSRNHNATRQNGEPNHAGNLGGRSVWFNWTAPASGDAVFDTMGSTLDTLLAVYIGNSLNGLTLVAENDDVVPDDADPDDFPFIGFSRVSFRATSGTTYRVAVDGHNFGAGAVSGSISLHYYSASAPPPNDNFANATMITGTKGQVAGNNLSATRQAGEPNHSISAGGRSVWFNWTAPASGQATFDTFGLYFDSVLAIYTGDSINALTPVVANDDIVPGVIQLSRASFPAMAGTTYRIAVDGYSNEVAGATADFNPFTLNWELAFNAPTNDLFAQARVLPGFSGSLTTSNTTAVFEWLEPLHGPVSGKSLWFKWTSLRNRDVTINTSGSAFDTLLAVYAGDNFLNLVSIAFNDDFTNLTSSVTIAATAGTTYFIAVDGYNPGNGRGSEHGTIVLNWSQPGGPPTNDYFADAFTLMGISGTTNGLTWDATVEPDEPDRGLILANASAWHRWTAPVSGWFTFDTLGSSIDTVLAVYVGSELASLQELGSNDNIDDAIPVLQSRVTFRATSGVTYQVAVDGKSGAPEGEFVLRWAPTAQLDLNVVGGNLHLTLTAAAGDLYNIEQSTNLVDWTFFTQVSAGSTPATVDLGPKLGSPSRFYRAAAP